MTVGLFASRLVAAGLVFACMAFGRRRPGRTAREAGAAAGAELVLPWSAPRLSYEGKPLLTAWERRALLSIRAQLPADFYVCLQARLADMLRITVADGMGRHTALNQVASKSVDFAVIELASAEVVFVVELDDRSHDRPQRRERDAIVNAALQHSSIPVRRFRPDSPIHVRDFFEVPSRHYSSA